MSETNFISPTNTAGLLIPSTLLKFAKYKVCSMQDLYGYLNQAVKSPNQH